MEKIIKKTQSLIDGAAGAESGRVAIEFVEIAGVKYQLQVLVTCNPKDFIEDCKDNQ